jgi:Na+/melibiose symporter-like transporter
MARLKEKIAYALGDAAAGGIVWKVMSIAFPLFFTNVFGLSFADGKTAHLNVLMLTRIIIVSYIAVQVPRTIIATLVVP